MNKFDEPMTVTRSRIVRTAWYKPDGWETYEETTTLRKELQNNGAWVSAEMVGRALMILSDEIKELKIKLDFYE